MKYSHNDFMHGISAQILPLFLIAEDDKASFGNGIVELASLRHEGFPIQKGFAISKEFYHHFLTPHLQKRIDHLLTTLHYERPDSLMQISSHIREDIMRNSFSAEMEEALIKSFSDLTHNKTTHVRLSVFPIRDSGQSVPNYLAPIHTFVDARSLLSEIKKAYTSLFTPHFLTYHHAHHLSLFESKLAIVVQHDISAEKSGVIHLTHPLLHKKNAIIIKSVHGDIQSLQDKHAIPEYIELRKTTGELIKHEQGLQKTIFHKMGSDIHVKNNTAPDGFVLTSAERNDLIILAQKLTRFLMVPRDILFSIHNGSIFITTLKPSTTIHMSPAPPPHERTLLTGTPYAPGIKTGLPKIIHTPKDFSNVSQGDIVVVNEVSPHVLTLAHKTHGIILEKNLPHGHLSIVLKRIGIPIIGNVENARKKIPSHSVITINGMNGTIQKVKNHASKAHEQHTHPPKIIAKIPHYPIFTSLERYHYDHHIKGAVIQLNDMISHMHITKFLKTLSTDNHIQTLLLDLQLLTPSQTFSHLNTLLPEIRKVYHAFPQLVLGIILPPLPSLPELMAYKKYFAHAGLHRSPHFKVIIKINTVVNASLLHELLHGGIDGVVIQEDALNHDLLENPSSQSLTPRSLIHEIISRHVACYLWVSSPDTLSSIRPENHTMITAILSHYGEN